MKPLGVILLLILTVGATPATKPSSRPGGEIVTPPRRDVPGKRITLPVGELYVPDFFHTAGQADLVVWFLGAPWCAEQVFYDARKNAVLLCVNAQTLKDGFARPEAFHDLLQTVADALNKADVTDEGLGRVVLTSFSGGWTGVYSVLQHAQLALLVSDVVLCDSLYARDKASGKIDPVAIDPFLRFARRAADGDGVFLFSHLYPPEEQYRGNGTTVCAAFLVDTLGVERKPGGGVSSRGTPILYRADKGNFHVLGYAGMTNQDHFDHFYSAADLLKRTSLSDVP
jgi:hypothetical protein